MDYASSAYARHGHAMPPSRTPPSRVGQTQGSIRGVANGVGGMLMGEDNRLYGASFPASPLNLARTRPHSANPAFRPLSGTTPGLSAAQPSAAAATTMAAASTPQLKRAVSTPRDRIGPPPAGGGAGGAAAARSTSAARSGGGGGAASAAAATSASAAGSKAASRHSATARVASSLGMSLLDRSIPAVRAAAALEDELAATRLRVLEAREDHRKAVATVRQLETQLQEERAVRVKMEDALATAQHYRRGATGPSLNAWAESGGTSSGHRRTYNGRSQGPNGDGDGDLGAHGGWEEGQDEGADRRIRPASASASASHLVVSLKRELRAVTATRDALATQLADVKAAARVQKVQELQSEGERYKAEAARQAGLVHLLSSRLDAAEAEAAEARAALAASKEAQEQATTEAVPLALPASNNLSRPTVRSALVVLQRAHKLIMAEARLLKSSFPPLLSMPELRELAAQRPNTAGAVEALLFLTSHLARLMDEVRGLPGVPHLRSPPGPAEGREPRDSAALTHGTVRPQGSLALDIDAQVKGAPGGTVSGAVGGPGSSNVAAMKAVKAAAAARANAAVAARAAAASARGSGGGSGSRSERVGGRSPGRTPRPASARASSSLTASGTTGRLGRGALLNPSGDPVAAAAAAKGAVLREQLAASVAALATEARERGLDGGAVSILPDPLAPAPPDPVAVTGDLPLATSSPQPTSSRHSVANVAEREEVGSTAPGGWGTAAAEPEPEAEGDVNVAADEGAGEAEGWGEPPVYGEDAGAGEVVENDGEKLGGSAVAGEGGWTEGPAGGEEVAAVGEGVAAGVEEEEGEEAGSASAGVGEPDGEPQSQGSWEEAAGERGGEDVAGGAVEEAGEEMGVGEGDGGVRADEEGEAEGGGEEYPHSYGEEGEGEGKEPGEPGAGAGGEGEDPYGGGEEYSGGRQEGGEEGAGEGGKSGDYDY